MTTDLDATSDTSTRRRTHEWEDPSPTAAAASTMDGLEFLRAMVSGELPAPPIMSLVGARIDSVREGAVSFTMVPAEFHYNPIGSVHGGIYAVLLDSAAGCSVHSTLPRGTAYTSLDLDVTFLRRITVDTGPVTCEGHVVHRGRRTALARATMTDAQGRLLAEASSNCLLFEG